MHVNILAVLVAAIAGMIVGGLWYSPLLFAKPWLKLNDVKDMKPGEGAVVGYITAFIGTLIMAYVLAHFIGYVVATTLWAGAVTGLWAWLGFTGTAFLTTYTFSNRPKKLWAIDAFQYLVVFMVMGAILAAWHK